MEPFLSRQDGRQAAERNHAHRLGTIRPTPLHFFPTFLLQPSDVPKPPPSLSAT